MAKFTLGTLLLLAGCSMEPQDTVRQAPETSAAPIHLISSFPAVGSSSRTARIIAPKLEEYFRRPVEIIYNEGGQGGDIGAQIAELGMVAAPSASPASFSAYIEEETARLGGVARKFNVVEN